MMTEITPNEKHPAPVLEEIALHSKTNMLHLTFEGIPQVQLSAEYLRISSPSAEVRGHGPGQEILQTGKANVRILAIHPVGRYGVLFEFSDGHKTGIYTFNYLYELADQHEQRWPAYLSALERANSSR